MAQNAGILALDIFFPNQYITQTALEQHNQVSAGRYSIGLGQDEMVFCTDAQDIYSLMLSAVARFMKQYDVDYNTIGRLEVGTETILDHSKSIKSVLMQLFEESGNTDLEGIDCINACYGGTNAVFSSLNWLESSAWDGRLALVVCGDIAEYAAGPARPTSGAGIVVMLLGPNAPLIVEQKTRATHMAHAWDFYKPHLSSPFPEVDGHHSQTCYLNSLDICFQRYMEKFERAHKRSFIFAQPNDVLPALSKLAEPAAELQAAIDEISTDKTVQTDVDYVVCHSPYNKLVQKSYARLFYLSALLRQDKNPVNSAIRQYITNQIQAADAQQSFPQPQQLSVLPPTASQDPIYIASLTDRVLERVVTTLSKFSYQTKIVPSTTLPVRLGNMYTASIWAGVLSLVSNVDPNQLSNARILCFSYGSGLAASMFSIKVANNDQNNIDQLTKIKRVANIEQRLAQRVIKTPAEMNTSLDFRAELHHKDDELYEPVPDMEVLQQGEYYLVTKDAHGKRIYAVKQ